MLGSIQSQCSIKGMSPLNSSTSGPWNLYAGMSSALASPAARAVNTSLSSDELRESVLSSSQKIPCGSIQPFASFTSEHQSVESINGYQQKPSKGRPIVAILRSISSHCSVMNFNHERRSDTNPRIFVSDNITGKRYLSAYSTAVGTKPSGDRFGN